MGERAATLLMSIVSLGPYLFLQGMPGLLPDAAAWLRCLSPIPAVMDVLGQTDVGSQGMVTASGAPFRYIVLALASIAVFAVCTVNRLDFSNQIPTQLLFFRPSVTTPANVTLFISETFPIETNRSVFA